MEFKNNLNFFADKISFIGLVPRLALARLLAAAAAAFILRAFW